MTWMKRIKAALKAGAFTPEDKDRAAHWGTCAVGEIGKRYPKVVMKVDDESHMPKNGSLDLLGGDFYDAVYEDRVQDAARIFAKIQDKTLKLALGIVRR